jgi:ABC-type polar amino acid transport system ATPase subunit
MVRRDIGIVFQSFNLFPHMTVLGNVMEGLVTVLRVPRNEAKERALMLLRKVGVSAKALERPSRLSGGQQQRVAIARALAIEPKVMLFDEVTSALDPELRAEVLEVMRELVAEGMTSIVVTHEMNFARKAAHRVIFIDEGVIQEEGPPLDVLRHPETERLQRFLNLVFWGSD